MNSGGLGGLLLIFDNARDAASLRPWLSRRGAAQIIVTSNAPNWGIDESY